MNIKSIFRHITFRVYILMKFISRWNMVDQFDTADFNNSITIILTKAGGLRI